ncbi:MAG: Uncharacterised protein [Hyphomonas sp. TMED17]|nr:MAG: Uncharacterised protein [Hyphomonas sp. TMED17]
MTGQRDRFLTDAFHQTAVSDQNIDFVIDETVTEAGIQMPFGDRHSDRCRDALPKRACGRFNTCGHKVFRVSGRRRVKLPERPDIVAADTPISGEMQEGIDQH